MEKLNLKWVSDTIGEAYKNWKKGDIVTIQAQTGTGKTYFVKNVLVPYMDKYEHMLIVSNRVNLKRQIKIDLLNKLEKEIPKDLEELDNIKTINGITILSYHQVAYLRNRQDNGLDMLNLNYYDYIVCDECHWFLSDASFSNLTEQAWKELIRTRHENAITIYISATMEDIIPMIESAYSEYSDKGFGLKNKLHKYTTGIDYSYLNPYYFNKIEDIAYTIKNDNSNNKWVVFVTSIKNAEFIKDKIGNKKKVGIITSKTDKDNEDLQSIIKNSKFKSDVLICTKVLDNGVNIVDEQVKNIVIMAWGRVTFVQEIGRIRIDIDNPYEIDLYIPKSNKSAFRSLEKTTSKKLELIDKYSKDIKEFKAEYRNNKNKLPDDIFYVTDEGYELNKLGYGKVIKDDNFYNNIIDKFSKGKNKEYSFIKEQLSWLGLEKEFNAMNLLMEISDEEEISQLENWLNNHINDRLYSDEQQELSDLIIKELTTVGNNIDYRTKKLKPKTLETLLRDELQLNFAIKEQGNNVNPKTKKKQRWISIGTIN